jgi:uncharacterized protein (DUF3084 family)
VDRQILRTSTLSHLFILSEATKFCDTITGHSIARFYCSITNTLVALSDQRCRGLRSKSESLSSAPRSRTTMALFPMPRGIQFGIPRDMAYYLNQFVITLHDFLAN